MKSNCILTALKGVSIYENLRSKNLTLGNMLYFSVLCCVSGWNEKLNIGE